MMFNAPRNQQTAPIFIMSSERSGSNLLRTLLDNHSNLTAPIAPMLLPTFQPLIPYYGDLSRQKNALTLLDDMLRVVNHPYYDWQMQVDANDLYERYQPSRLLDFVYLFYREKQISHGGNRFVCKENRIFDFACSILAYDPTAKFLYLYRDPRDYAASFLRMPVAPHTAFAAAQKWTDEQKKCIELMTAYQLPVLPVRYEALITEPQKVMSSVLTFLGETVETSCFQVDPRKNEKDTWNVAWKNLSRPVMRQNFGKYHTELSHRDIQIIETVAKEPMQLLGYALETDGGWEKPWYFRGMNFIQNRLTRRKVRRQHRDTFARILSRQALLDDIARKRKAAWNGKALIALEP